MTNEDWDKVKASLEVLSSIVKLKIDGYDVSFTLVRESTYKNVILVFIGGELCGKWLLEECEERRRFFQKCERSVLSTREKAKFKKMSKREQKQFSDYINRTYAFYSPHWTSFTSLKRHLIANNESIELVRTN
jgi:hypothetical protein